MPRNAAATPNGGDDDDAPKKKKQYSDGCRGGGGVGGGGGASTAELAVAGILAVTLFGGAVLKAVVMSVRHDPGVSPAWRARCATVEALLGFGGGGDGAGAGAGGGRGGADEGGDASSSSSSSPPPLPPLPPLPYGRDYASGAVRLPGLRPNGWVFGRANDMSDHQWRTFRGNLPKLALVVAVTAPLCAAVRRWAPKSASVPFHAVYGLVFVVYLHGVRTLWIAALALAHFTVCRVAAGAPRVAGGHRAHTPLIHHPLVYSLDRRIMRGALRRGIRYAVVMITTRLGIFSFGGAPGLRRQIKLDT